VKVEETIAGVFRMLTHSLSFDYLYRGRCAYSTIYRQMCRYTHSRTAPSADQFWLLEHEAVYTCGRRQAHLALPQHHHAIPVVATDRGGQTSYHGPGQAILYTLLNLRRLRIRLRAYIQILEETIVLFLAQHGIAAARINGAPGVYVRGAKIASLGLCVYKHYCYHGIAVNVDMDLTPFDYIVACGLADIKMTQMADYGIRISVGDACYQLADILAAQLNWHYRNTAAGD